MSFISVCKNVIASNNKRKWVDPDPPIRISGSPSGKALIRAFDVEILDEKGDAVAEIRSTTDGKPILKCGAKVAIATKYHVRVIE